MSLRQICRPLLLIRRAVPQEPSPPARNTALRFRTAVDPEPREDPYFGDASDPDEEKVGVTETRMEEVLF